MREVRCQNHGENGEGFWPPANILNQSPTFLCRGRNYQTHIQEHCTGFKIKSELLAWICRLFFPRLFFTWLWRKIGPQCVLEVLRLNLFLSVGMLFSNISIWEFNWYKWKGRQVITTFKWKMYGRILFTYRYVIFISNNNWRFLCKKGIHGQFHITDNTFRGQILKLKLFLTYLSKF